MKAKLSKIRYPKPRVKATTDIDPTKCVDELAIFKFDEELALEAQQMQSRAPIYTICYRPTLSSRCRSPKPYYL
jgi:hypothetical protein